MAAAGSMGRPRRALRGRLQMPPVGMGREAKRAERAHAVPTCHSSPLSSPFNRPPTRPPARLAAVGCTVQAMSPSSTSAMPTFSGPPPTLSFAVSAGRRAGGFPHAAAVLTTSQPSWPANPLTNAPAPAPAHTPCPAPHLPRPHRQHQLSCTQCSSADCLSSR